MALKRRPAESWVTGERLPGGAASSQVAGQGEGQGCFEEFRGDFNVDLKVTFDHLGPSKVLQRVQNFPKEGVWERQPGGKLDRRSRALFAQQYFYLDCLWEREEL